MSEPRSWPPISPGIAYAVRRLLEYGPESEPEARRLCEGLWPRMDVDAVETVVVYWRTHNQSASPDMVSGPPATVAKVA
jgi:hypothetical protein